MTTVLSAPRQSTLDLLEDVDWMLSTGETPTGVLARTGRNAHSIAKLARTYGYLDIARIFERKTT